MKTDPRLLKQAMDVMDWFSSNRQWLVEAAVTGHSYTKSVEMSDKLSELDTSREHLRQMFISAPIAGRT
jgi:hypothetical protein